MDRDARRVRELGITTFAVGVQGAFVPELRVSSSVANWLNEWLPPLKQKAQVHFWAVQIDHQMDHTAWLNVIGIIFLYDQRRLTNIIIKYSLCSLSINRRVNASR